MNTLRNLFILSVVAASALISAKASIVYSGEKNISYTINDYRISNPYIYPNPDALSLDFNLDGTADFQFFTHSIFPGFTLPGARGLNGSYYLSPNSTLLAPLPQGESIGDGPQWFSDTSRPAPSLAFDQGQNWWHGGHWFGYLSNPGFDIERYCAFALRNAFGVNYGWFGLTFSNTNNVRAFKISGWAYESSSNAPIKAGVLPPVSKVPDGSSSIALLGVSLLGVFAFVTKRLRKSAA